jgi:hypothetical protein
VHVTVSPELSAIIAVADAVSEVLPPEGSAHVSEVNVLAWPATAPASTSRYVPSARPEIVRVLPEARSWKGCAAPEYDHATPGGVGSVSRRTTIEPASPPAAPAADTATPRLTAATVTRASALMDNSTRLDSARRRKSKPAHPDPRVPGQCAREDSNLRPADFNANTCVSTEFLIDEQRCRDCDQFGKVLVHAGQIPRQYGCGDSISDALTFVRERTTFAR